MRPMVADSGSRTVESFEFRVSSQWELTISTPSSEAGAKYSCLTLRSSCLNITRVRKAARSVTGVYSPSMLSLTIL